MAFGAVSASAETAVFKYTGGEQEFTVPAGVKTIEVTATGGAGGNGASGNGTGGAGGLGAVVSGSLAVKEGQTLYVEVAGNGAGGGEEEDEGVGGFNGGGGETYGAGGGGGGASDVREVARATSGTLGSRLIVAAGGGGGGLAYCPFREEEGGAGGSAEQPGTGGSECPTKGGTIGGGGGGGPGTSSKGGQGGKGIYDGETGHGGGLGQGGAGELGVAGGGGGGLYGGGGGGFELWNAAGGGGGSNLVPTEGTAELAAEGAEPMVKITYQSACTMAVGRGSYQRRGEAGRLTLLAKLNTSMAGKQVLRINYQSGAERFRLTSLTDPKCETTPDGHVFSGTGTAAMKEETGWTISFTITEANGQFDFTATLTKGGNTIIEGAPLRKTTLSIS